jgi:hypothetical protein
MLGVLGVSSVNIISSTFTESPIILDPFNSSFSRRSVRKDASYSVLLSPNTEVTLNREVFMISSKTRQTVKCWVRITSLLLDGLIWKIDHELHFTVVNFTPVLYSLK